MIPNLVLESMGLDPCQHSIISKLGIQERYNLTKMYLYYLHFENQFLGTSTGDKNHKKNIKFTFTDD